MPQRPPEGKTAGLIASDNEVIRNQTVTPYGDRIKRSYKKNENILNAHIAFVLMLVISRRQILV